MSESPVFAFVTEELERRTHLKRIEARGTIRLALKEAGLEPRAVTTQQMNVVIERLLPDALRRRKVSDPDEVCADILHGLRAFASRSNLKAEESAYDVFRRLGGD